MIDLSNPTPDLIDHVAQNFQDYNALKQQAQCLASGYQVPDSPQFKLWENLEEVERDYVRAIANVAILSIHSYPKPLNIDAILINEGEYK